MTWGLLLAMTADTVLAQSAIDRLTAYAQSLVVEGPSYRQRDGSRLDPSHPNEHPQQRATVVPSPWQSGGPITLASDTCSHRERGWRRPGQGQAATTDSCGREGAVAPDGGHEFGLPGRQYRHRRVVRIWRGCQ